jgi:hypothetical protein
MNQIGRLFAMLFIFSSATIAWFVLGGITATRGDTQESSLSGRVHDLWGTELRQPAPAFRAEWQVKEEHEETTRDDAGVERTRRVMREVTKDRPLIPDATRAVVDLHDDVRRKGLVWFPLYDVDFHGSWTVTVDGDRPVTMVIPWIFPDPNAFYDGFSLTVDGVEQPVVLQPGSGEADVRIPVTPGQKLEIAVAYSSRGSGTWTFQPTQGVGELRDFSLAMTTDFADIDYPSGALSPSDATETPDGWKLAWTFDRMISGKAIGMIVPNPVQPGELSSAMSWSAPISLGLFMIWIHVLSLVKRIDVHPVHHAFMAAAFFAFHLLFAYSADHLAVEVAFGLSAVVSCALVVSYLYRVVSPRFAFVEAGLAQVVYLVGFALAHFWDGYTGLTVTVIGILTLFFVMQLTSHIRWGAVFGDAEPQPA